jgi:hypothetical protein
MRLFVSQSDKQLACHFKNQRENSSLAGAFRINLPDGQNSAQIHPVLPAFASIGDVHCVIFDRPQFGGFRATACKRLIRIKF